MSICRLTVIAAAAILSGCPAFAQVPFPEGNPRLTITPSLPVRYIDPDAGPTPFLITAREAVATGRFGDAEEAIERTETRLLDRRALASTESQPDIDHLIQDLATARQNLAARDRSGAARVIDNALLAMRETPEQASAGEAGFALATPTRLTPPNVPEGLPLPAMFPPPLRQEPSVTYALLPGHWHLDGARYVWIPPETVLRRVEERPIVGGVNVWRDGHWTFVPQHYGSGDGS
jgi:hypothetical protein